MLAVILAAALTPNSGSVAAQSSCPYGDCTSGSGSGFPWISVFVALAVILAAIILAMLVLYYRRRSPPPPPPEGGAGNADNSTTDASAPPPSSSTVGSEESTSSNPSYIEAAQYFGIPPLGSPATTAWPSQTWTGMAATPGTREALAAEVDSVVMEIDILSSEMLKRSAP